MGCFNKNIIFFFIKFKQITLFLNAVNQYQPNVNVIGFYEINRGLLGSVSGGIIGQRSPPPYALKIFYFSDFILTFDVPNSSHTTEFFVYYAEYCRRQQQHYNDITGTWHIYFVLNKKNIHCYLF